MPPKPERFELRIDADQLARIDEWAADEPAERVNDFAPPGVMNLLRKVVLISGR